MSTVFKIAEDLRALDELLDECGGELTPETEPIFEAFFAELATDQEAKLDNYAHLISELNRQAVAARATAEGFARVARARERSVDRIKDRLLWFMQGTGQKKALTTSGWTFAVQANGGKDPVLINDGVSTEDVPAAYLRITVEIDKDKVRDAIKAGESIDFATLGERGVHLRLKP